MDYKNFQEVAFSLTQTKAIRLGSMVMSGIQIPDDAAFNSKTMEIQASYDGTDFAPVYDSEGAKLVVSLGAKRFIPLFLNDFTGAVYVKFVASESLDGKKIIIGYTEILR